MAVNKDGVYIAEDKDFQYIESYWIYKGVPLEVDITDFVNNKKLTSTRYMFSGSSKYGSTAVKRVALGKNSVTDMNFMFQSSQATSLDLSSFNTSSVINMDSMFSRTQATSLDLSGFDTSSVINMTSMFDSSQATNLDLSSFNTSSVTNMYYMFYKSQATSLDLSSFNTSSVTNMNSMFSRTQATSLDLSSFNTSSVINMDSMFSRTQATNLDLSSFNTSRVTTMDYMFYDSRATTGYARIQADADKFNSSSGKPEGLVFVAKFKDGVYIAEDKDFQYIESYWIYKGVPLEVDITDFVNNKKLTSTRYMFSGSSNYGSTAVKRVVLGKNSVTDMSSMFRYSQATSLDLSSFDTSSVTSMNYMFADSQATSLDLSSFDTSRVTDMRGMFWDSRATTGYARYQADADKFNSSSNKPEGLVFVVKPKSSFGRLNNLKIKSMLHKDSNGIIKQVKTLKFKDNLGNITKLK